MGKRDSGLLLHITSLPSPFGIGDMGPRAYQFVDFLAEAGQSCWQILPLNPTDLEHGNSPYHSSSAFACNPLVISPELLVREGFLDEKDVEISAGFPDERVDYRGVTSFKEKLFLKAYERFRQKEPAPEYEAFCRENVAWLEDFALFKALKSLFHGEAWNRWPEGIRDRREDALGSVKREVMDQAEREKFFQWIFFKQWFALRAYCNEKGVKVIGDVPIYVVHDSADIWIHPDLVKLDEQKRPYAVAGVPPDYFSETGQLWGNPVYRWDVLKERGYDWWIRRIEHNLRLFDYVRIDHFRGFVAYWQVPATEKTAVNGQWIEAPAEDFFSSILNRIPLKAIIAEDLGTITQDVREIMDRFGFSGMKVLLFAFGPDLPTNPFIPHNHVENCIVYTGTHDLNTVRGWFETELSAEDRSRLFRYLGREVPAGEIHRELIRLAMMSVADRVIFPMQDLLGLGEEFRMNRPATKEGNWEWRLVPDRLTRSLALDLRELTEIYGRAQTELGEKRQP